MIKEFRDFIAKGNVMDMAVGIIVGAAFTAIVTSLVGDLINPVIGLFTGGIDFSGWFYKLAESDCASVRKFSALRFFFAPRISRSPSTSCSEMTVRPFPSNPCSSAQTARYKPPLPSGRSRRRSHRRGRR